LRCEAAPAAKLRPLRSCARCEAALAAKLRSCLAPAQIGREGALWYNGARLER